MNDYEYVANQIKKNIKEKNKLEQEALDSVDYDKLYNSIIEELSKKSELGDSVKISSPHVRLYRFEEVNKKSLERVKKLTETAIEVLEDRGIPKEVSTDVYLFEKVFRTIGERLGDEGFEATISPINARRNISISVSLKREDKPPTQTSKIVKTETLLDKINKFFFRKK